MQNTPFIACFTKGDTSASNSLFTPTTPPLPSQRFEAARFTLEAFGSDVKLLPGLRYSDDGIVWDTPERLNDGTGWVSVSTTIDGVTYIDGYKDCPADFGTTAPTQKLFVQFGVFARNDTGTDIVAAQVQLGVEAKKIVSGSISGGPMTTCSAGSSTELFTPLTKAVQTTDMTSLRATWELQCSTGDAESRPGYQVSNNQMTWVTPAALGTYTARTTEGITYGTAIDVSFDKTDDRWVRFGVLVKNNSGGVPPHACVSSIRVDWRK